MSRGGWLVRRLPLHMCEVHVLALENCTHVIHFLQFLQKRHDLVQLAVVFVMKPAGDWDGIVRLEDVRIGRIVYDQGTAQFPPENGQVLWPEKHSSIRAELRSANKHKP